LIVEDIAVSGAFTATALTAEGATVRIATSEEEALSVCSDFRPRLIVLDLVLSRMSSLSFAKRARLRDSSRDTLFVAVTTIDASEAQSVARAAGCDGYITWPIDTHTFARSIATYLQEHANRRERSRSLASVAPVAESGSGDHELPLQRAEEQTAVVPSVTMVRPRPKGLR
jgi:DNA-binding response OmpR family regulator